MAFLFFRILQAPSCLTTSFENALHLGNLWLRLDMLCQEVTVWTKKTFTTGSLPIGHTGAFHIAVAWDTEHMETLRSRLIINDDRSTETTSCLVMHLIKRRLGANTWTQGCNNVPLRYPPRALAALSISKVDGVGLWSCRCTFCFIGCKIICC